jgi:hypothetical protein
VAIKTVSVTGLEKLDPPTTVAGRTAEVASVVRYYRENTETLERTEYGTPEITVLWGKAVADVVADLEATKADVAARAVAEVAELDKRKTDLEAKPIADEKITP